MTELETIQRAKLYIDKLTQGIDPITNREIGNDSVLNNVRIVRCFSYISLILQKNIEEFQKEEKDTKNYRFSISRQQLEKICPYPYPVQISTFVELLYKSAGDPQMKRPGTTKFSDWLMWKGFLQKEETEDGEFRRLPTKAGKKLGISVQKRKGIHGEYTAVYYDSGAQQFLLDHYWEIIGRKSGRG